MADVVEHYRDWAPPKGVRATIDGLLAETPQQYLRGLGCVVLTNSASLTGNRRRGKTVSRKRKVPLHRCRGLYHHAHRGRLAYIELFVDNCLRPLPRQLHRFSFLLEFELGPIWFHELGHHIHSNFAREHAEREDVADRWSSQLFRAHARRKYWWLRILLYPARLMLFLWPRFRQRAGRTSPQRPRRAA